MIVNKGSRKSKNIEDIRDPKKKAIYEKKVALADAGQRVSFDNGSRAEKSTENLNYFNSSVSQSDRIKRMMLPAGNAEDYSPSFTFGKDKARPDGTIIKSKKTKKKAIK